MGEMGLKLNVEATNFLGTLLKQVIHGMCAVYTWIVVCYAKAEGDRRETVVMPLQHECVHSDSVMIPTL